MTGPSGPLLEDLRAAHDSYTLLGPLDQYEEGKYGPLLGISDSGHSADLIAQAGLQSPKMRWRNDPQTNGLILDAERMGSAGEVPVGPEEYVRVARAALGRTFFTTNVGVRTNARYLQPHPELNAADLRGEGAEALVPLAALYEPFLNPPGGPRPLTVHLRVEPGSDLGELGAIAGRIEGMRGGQLGDASLHRIGALAVFAAAPGKAEIDWAEEFIVSAANAQFPVVAFDGPPVDAARIRLGVQGLLGVLAPADANRLLAAGAAHGVAVLPRFQVDTESVARTIWAGLYTARAHGLNAAKYGLTPLTLEEQRAVIEVIQRTMTGWTTVPAFYADTPLATANHIYLSDEVIEASRLWLRMAREAGAEVVLFDCPDRYTPRIDSSGQSSGRRLLRSGPDDEGGAYSLDEIDVILAEAGRLGMRILWSGGIRPEQAFELAKRRVTGIFTTSSTALPGPVSPVLAHDPRLATENLPTQSGVRRVHALIQAGFLISTLDGAPESKEIERLYPVVLGAALESDELDAALTALDAALIQGWSRHGQS